MHIHNNPLKELGATNLVLYLIGINNQQDTLACRNGSGHFITEVNVTLQRDGEST